jgi:hypothetical protein
MGFGRLLLYFSLFAGTAGLVEYLVERWRRRSAESDADRQQQQQQPHSPRKLTIVRDPSFGASSSTSSAQPDTQARWLQQFQQQAGVEQRAVATVDYLEDNRAPGALKFRAGDQFIVQRADPSGWCFVISALQQDGGMPSAVAAADDGTTATAAAGRQDIVSGWVSGKLLRPLADPMRKL